MRSKTKLEIAAIMALITAFTYLKNYGRYPKILQDLKNILTSINPLSRIYDMINAVPESEARAILYPGDHIYCHRTYGYSHHGIYAGNGEVWAYQGENLDGAKICKVSLHEFSNGDVINKLNYTADFDPQIILLRAESRNNETDYNLVSNNCMIYAFWCRLATKENIDATSMAFNNIINIKNNEQMV